MLLNPVREVLQQSGLVPARNGKPKISEVMEERGLSLDRTVDSLAETMVSDDESIKLRATELALKLHGVLKEAAEAPPSITFIIQGDAVANILTPRQ